MAEWIIEPLTYGFALRGLVAGLLAAISCAALSAFVVWRGMSFIGDAMAHSILPGIVVAYVFGISLFIGALFAALVAAIGIGFLTRNYTMREDTAIGVIYTGLFALGIILLSKVAGYQDLTHILFGNILGVDTSDIIIMLVITLLVSFLVVSFYKELLATSFDPGHSVAIGLSPETVRYGLLFLIALTVVAGIKTVGVVLVLALLVTPAAVASLVTRRLVPVMLISEAVAIFSAITGFYLSFYLDIASGAAIVLMLSAVFVLVYGITWLRNRMHQ